MKYVPNILTCIRIIGSAALLLFKPLSIAFFLLYIVCGVTDVLDGYIARKTKNISKSGAALDSMADMIFIAVMLFVIFPIFSLEAMVVFWTIGIAAARILSLIVGYAKYKTFAGLHTYGNKATGLILFLFPFMYQLFGIVNAEYIILVIASLSALEELVINITSRTLNVNIKGLFLP
jgi:CDP-diacylglycerol--glycerol-3-phosphate 3-phosphatidyltransferase